MGEHAYASYQRLRVLGRGQHGCAVLLRAPAGGECVVAKEISLDSGAASEPIQLQNEVRILQSLHHRHIIAYIDSFVQHNVLTIVMEYAPGGTLADMVAASSASRMHFASRTVVRWLTELTSALQHVHSRRVLHRDIKTANVFLTANDEPHVKLGDFGVSRSFSTETNLAETMCGTPYYLSPELVRGTPYAEPSDVWALGVILFELLALERPFTAPNGALGALVLSITSGNSNITPLRSSPHPWWLTRLVNRANLLHPDPTERMTLVELRHVFATVQRAATVMQRRHRRKTAQQLEELRELHRRYAQGVEAETASTAEAPEMMSDLEDDAIVLPELRTETSTSPVLADPLAGTVRLSRTAERRRRHNSRGALVEPPAGTSPADGSPSADGSPKAAVHIYAPIQPDAQVGGDASAQQQQPPGSPFVVTPAPQFSIPHPVLVGNSPPVTRQSGGALAPAERRSLSETAKTRRSTLSPGARYEESSVARSASEGRHSFRRVLGAFTATEEPGVARSASEGRQSLGRMLGSSNEDGMDVRSPIARANRRSEGTGRSPRIMSGLIDSIRRRRSLGPGSDSPASARDSFVSVSHESVGSRDPSSRASLSRDSMGHEASTSSPVRDSAVSVRSSLEDGSSPDRRSQLRGDQRVSDVMVLQQQQQSEPAAGTVVGADALSAGATRSTAKPSVGGGGAAAARSPARFFTVVEPEAAINIPSPRQEKAFFATPPNLSPAISPAISPHISPSSSPIMNPLSVAAPPTLVIDAVVPRRRSSVSCAPVQPPIGQMTRVSPTVPQHVLRTFGNVADVGAEGSAHSSRRRMRRNSAGASAPALFTVQVDDADSPSRMRRDAAD